MWREKELEDQLFEIGLVFLAVFAVGLLLYEPLIKPLISVRPCFFATFLGIYCPGCGGSRAVEALLHGHLFRSVWYHPLVPYTAILYDGFMFSHALHRFGVGGIRGWRFHDWYLYGAIVIIVVNFVVKNVLKLCCGITL